MSHDKESNLQRLTYEIRQLLIKISNLSNKKPEDIDPDTPLLGSGLGIDSIDLLELIVELDKKYGLKIRNNEEGRQTLRNVVSIAEAVYQVRTS